MKIKFASIGRGSENLAKDQFEFLKLIENKNNEFGSIGRGSENFAQGQFEFSYFIENTRHQISS